MRESRCVDSGHDDPLLIDTLRIHYSYIMNFVSPAQAGVQWNLQVFAACHSWFIATVMKGIIPRNRAKMARLFVHSTAIFARSQTRQFNCNESLDSRLRRNDYISRLLRKCAMVEESGRQPHRFVWRARQHTNSGMRRARHHRLHSMPKPYRGWPRRRA